MKQEINEWDFLNAFRQSEERKDQFSYYGLKALYEHLTECEDDENKLELDIIAICCDFSEYDSAIDACEDIGLDFDYEQSIDELSDDEIDEDREKQALAYLQDRTQVIECKHSIIIQDY